MTEFLVFTLAARMAAMGGLAGHERRGTHNWPGRSALIGLLGAARGIRRDDASGQAALCALSFAVAVYDTGAPLRDYHTVQTVPQKFRRPATRAAALAAAARTQDLNTTITLRDYRCGVLYAVAAWGAEATALQDLAGALARPVFTLYLGRKSCPLSLPAMAHVVAAENPAAALSQADIPQHLLTAKDRNGLPAFIACDPLPGVSAGRRESRHDQPLDRGLWHFAAREVHFIREAE